MKLLILLFSIGIFFTSNAQDMKSEKFTLQKIEHEDKKGNTSLSEDKKSEEIKIPQQTELPNKSFNCFRYRLEQLLTGETGPGPRPPKGCF